MTDHWTCNDALDLVEPIAAGDVEVDALLRAHFETCPRCAAALASARRVEAALTAREAPAPPQGFTHAVMVRIRRERWRSEQRVDRVFNLGIAAAIVLVLGGIAALLNVSGVLGMAGAAWQLVSAVTRGGVQEAAPTLRIYVGAAAFMACALAMWWWAERRLSL